MIRNTIARLLQLYWEFVKRHPAISLVFSLVIIAACLGGLYLIALDFPTLMSMPCFTGGCS